MDPQTNVSPGDHRGSSAHPRAHGGRFWVFVALGITAFLTAGGLAASLTVASTTGGAGGVQDGSAFMIHWQQNGVASAAIPNPVPGAASQAVVTPTRLPGAGLSFRLNAAVVGHQAVEWSFTESVGMPVNQEVEIAFAVQYSVGGVSHSGGGMVYLESQAAAIGAAVTYNFYWDSGAAAGITFGAETEISQACSAVGTCP